MVAVKSGFSCSATESIPRHAVSSNSAIGLASSRMRPAVGSKNLTISEMIVLLPEPLGPAIAVISPARASRLTPASTGDARVVGENHAVEARARPPLSAESHGRC